MASSAYNRQDKHLRYSEVHFQGYWVQLNTLIRKNEDADLLVDGILENPMIAMVQAVEDKDTSESAIPNNNNDDVNSMDGKC